MAKPQLFTFSNIQAREAVEWGDPLKAVIKAKYVKVSNGYESGTPVYRLRTPADDEAQAEMAQMDAEDKARRERDYRDSFIGRQID